jgi:hypothetical protein
MGPTQLCPSRGGPAQQLARAPPTQPPLYRWVSCHTPPPHPPHPGLTSPASLPRCSNGVCDEGRRKTGSPEPPPGQRDPDVYQAACDLGTDCADCGEWVFEGPAEVAAEWRPLATVKAKNVRRGRRGGGGPRGFPGSSGELGGKSGRAALLGGHSCWEGTPFKAGCWCTGGWALEAPAWVPFAPAPTACCCSTYLPPCPAGPPSSFQPPQSSFACPALHCIPPPGPQSPACSWSSKQCWL